MYGHQWSSRFAQGYCDPSMLEIVLCPSAGMLISRYGVCWVPYSYAHDGGTCMYEGMRTSTWKRYGYSRITFYSCNAGKCYIFVAGPHHAWRTLTQVHELLIAIVA